MNNDKKTAKIDMFFGYRFGVALGWVLEGVWEAKNLNFGRFFEEKSKAKTVDLLEGLKKPSSRGKKQSPEGLTEWEGDRGNKIPGQVACWGGRGGTTKNQHTGYSKLPTATVPLRARGWRGARAGGRT